MKVNSQNIEVGDVVTFRNTTSIVMEVTENNSAGNCIITVYFNGGSVKVDIQVEDVRIVRKWNGSIPLEQVKQSAAAPSTYSFLRISDKSFETLVLAVKLIEGLTSADIAEVDRANQIIEVTQNLIDKLCEFVNTKRRMFDLDCGRDIKFDGCGFWINNERIGAQCFLDDVVEPIIVEELKRRILANVQ